MFEDQQSSAGAPPANLPTEPVDMFAGVEDTAPIAAPKMPDALSSGLLKRKDSATSGAGAKAPASVPLSVPAEPAEGLAVASLSQTSQPILGKILAAVLIVAALGGIGWGGWWLYATYIQKAPASLAPAPTAPAPAVVQTPAAVTPPSAETPSAPQGAAPAAGQPLVAETPTSTITTNIKNDTILFGEPVDSDKDGLDDTREKELGTSPTNPDTDGDGLIDGDEVLIWKTNPLNPDTDGDGYPDGEEVQNGYNPLGRGRLLKSPTSTAPVATTTP